MAKKEIGRDGKITRSAKRTRYIEGGYNQVDAEMRKRIRIQIGPQAGPRSQVLHAYERNGNRNDAYAVAETINKKIGKKAYTREMVDKWIDEQNNKSRQREAFERDGNAR